MKQVVDTPIIPSGFKQCKAPFTKYYISPDGQQLFDSKYNEYVKTHIAPQGYVMFNSMLNDDGKITVPRMHRIIAINLIPVPEKYKDIPIDKLQVNHIDENTSNNQISNLEWCTPKENMYHGGAIERSRRNINLRREILQYDQNTGELIRIYHTIRETELYGFSDDAVSRCCNGMYKQHKGYVFKYGDVITDVKYNSLPFRKQIRQIFKHKVGKEYEGIEPTINKLKTILPPDVNVTFNNTEYEQPLYPYNKDNFLIKQNKKSVLFIITYNTDNNIIRELDFKKG